MKLDAAELKTMVSGFSGPTMSCVADNTPVAASTPARQLAAFVPAAQTPTVKQQPLRPALS